ncbi:MAG: hypothetical protein RJB13_878 [Pseudomonadota bacterium]
MRSQQVIQLWTKIFAVATVWCAAPAHASIAEKVYGGIFSKHRKSSAQQKRSRTNTTVMGVRGLDADSESEQKAYATANMRAVYQMEDREPNEAIVRAIQNSIDRGAQSSHMGLNRLPNAAPTLQELEAEVELGRKMAAQILGSYQLVESEEIQDYAQALVSLVANAGLSAPRPFRLAVISSPSANAFACPGGYIFVTLGALKSVKNESELSALLGHEIVHVSQRHLLATLQKKITIKSNESEKRTSDVYMAARQRIKPEQSDEKESWSTLLGPKGVGLTLLQASSEALDTLFSKGLEQEFELDADKLGAQMSALAGYRAESLLALLKGLSSTAATNQRTMNSTHPPFPLRIQKLEQFLSPMQLRADKEPTSSTLFQSTQKLWMAL